MNKARNPQLTPTAKALRKNMTPEEKHLWYDFLKKLPQTVYRQKVIGPYLARILWISMLLVRKQRLKWTVCSMVKKHSRKKIGCVTLIFKHKAAGFCAMRTGK